jgi:hypothetical protein
MQRFVATTWRGFGIWLLLLAMVSPSAVLCAPRFLDEKEGQKNGSHEEERTKEVMIHPARRQRWDTHQTQLPGISAPPRSLHMLAAHWHGQVCVADGLLGEHQARNGCGASLLR